LGHKGKLPRGFTLVGKMQMTIRITTILCEWRIKLLVEGLMWSIMFLTVHDRVDFVALGSLQHRI
jgi:hypothetical protein